MSDLACWRQNIDQVVVRIRGNEHLMNEAEATELASHIDNVVQYCLKESLGEDYKDLRRNKAKAILNSVRQSPQMAIANIKAALGLNRGTFRR